METPNVNEKRPMALTRDFKETVKARAERDVAFREALLTEAVERLIAGEVEVGKAVLRDYINATVGFEKLAKATGTPSKSLMRMFGPKGNPRANSLFAVIGKLQRVSGVRLAVASGSRNAQRRKLTSAPGRGDPRMRTAKCGIIKSRMSRSLSSGVHSRDALAHPGYACCPKSPAASKS
jgi:DNA-binding phage protein